MFNFGVSKKLPKTARRDIITLFFYNYAPVVELVDTLP